MQAIDPTEPIDANEPADPMLRIDPAEPIDRIEPAEPMLRIDPADPIDKMESPDPAALRFAMPGILAPSMPRRCSRLQGAWR